MNEKQLQQLAMSIDPLPQTNAIFKSDYSKQLLNKLNEMRNDSKLCDYEIRCNGQVFKAHKCVLIATHTDYYCQPLLNSQLLFQFPPLNLILNLIK